MRSIKGNILYSEILRFLQGIFYVFFIKVNKYLMFAEFTWDRNYTILFPFQFLFPVTSEMFKRLVRGFGYSNRSRIDAADTQHFG